MKFINPVLLVSDEATGKAYARQLSPWEQNLVLQQLQALDGGALKMTEIAPVIIRGVNVSEERARHIVEKQQSLHLSARTGVQAFEDMAKAPGIAEQLIGKRTEYPQKDVGHKNINARINAKLPPSLVDAMAQPPACDHHWIASEGRTASGWLCSKCGDYDGPFTERNYNPEKYQK